MDFFFVQKTLRKGDKFWAMTEMCKSFLHEFDTLSIHDSLEWMARHEGAWQTDKGATP